MDFARRPHILSSSVTSKSGIRTLEEKPDVDESNNKIDSLAIKAANEARISFFQQEHDPSSPYANCDYYPDRKCPISDNISVNSLVVIFESFDNLKFCYAAAGEKFHNRNGIFYHDDFIGKPFGSKIRSRSLHGAGFVYVLRPSAELWSQSLNHRTQIVNDLDASMIVFQLYLKPGCVVLEAGTGSGSMSHAILRCIAPSGHLHTFEFNHLRVKKAKEEFEKNQVQHLVTVHHKDVCAAVQDTDTAADDSSIGFGVGKHVANAIFLDLPSPWLAIKAASHALMKNGRIATYSPCIEQTQRTCEALKLHGFHSIRTMEVRLREYYVQEVLLEPLPFTIINDKRVEKHDLSIYTNKQTMKDTQSTAKDDNYIPLESTHDTDLVSNTDRQTTKDTQSTAKDDNCIPLESTHDTTKPTTTSTTVQPPANAKKRKLICARPFATMKGHTAFLTFATSGLADN